MTYSHIKGGTVFPTSRKTVLSSPKLMQLLHNKKYNKDNDTMHIPKDQYWHEISDNEFFIDRDPTHFRYILNHIRNNTHCVLPNDSTTRREQSIEANFYELPSLVTLLNYNKDADGDDSAAVDESVHIPSNLITKNESHLLTQWIKENDGDDSNELCSIDLLFRASEYGFVSNKNNKFLKIPHTVYLLDMPISLSFDLCNISRQKI